jgi:hypothetical protein
MMVVIMSHPPILPALAGLHRTHPPYRLRNIDDAKVYLMHFPIRGPASVRVRELTEVKLASDES